MESKIITTLLVVLVVLPGVHLMNLEGSTTPAEEEMQLKEVVRAEKCSRCHENEYNSWLNSHHFNSFTKLGNERKAREIVARLGGEQQIYKRSDCMKCHATRQWKDNEPKPVAGVSCESCHGPAKKWLKKHNRGPELLAEAEEKHGMIRPGNLHGLAQNCLGCHIMPNEELVNVGGHPLGSITFEIVAWSQGEVRHNFAHLLREEDSTVENKNSSDERKRIMYTIGKMVEFEYCLRAYARAKEQGNKYEVQTGLRILTAYRKMKEIRNLAPLAELEKVKELLAKVKLRSSKPGELFAVADQIRTQIDAVINKQKQYEETLQKIDPLMPTEYIGTSYNGN